MSEQTPDDPDPFEKADPAAPATDETLWQSIRSSLNARNAQRRAVPTRRSDAERAALIGREGEQWRAELRRLQGLARAGASRRGVGVQRWLPQLGLAACLVVGIGVFFTMNRPEAPIYRGGTHTPASVAVEDPLKSANDLVTALAAHGVKATASETEAGWVVELKIPAKRVVEISAVLADAGVASVEAGDMRVTFRVRLPDEKPAGS